MPMLCPACGTPVFDDECVADAGGPGQNPAAVVGAIYRAEGYATEIPGRDDPAAGFTLVARRGAEQVAVACMYPPSAVGIAEVRDLAAKIDDLGPGWRGVFVAAGGVAPDARNFAESRNIEVLGHDDIVERQRIASAPPCDRLTLSSTLPVRVDYPAVTALPLQNGHLVTVSTARLIFHPYARVPYRFRARKDGPAWRPPWFSDDGTVVVDLLDGTVLTGEGASEPGGDRARSPGLLTEVLNASPVPEYAATGDATYQIVELKPGISLQAAEEAAVAYITAKNTRDLGYTPVMDDPQSRMYVPKRSDIELSASDVVSIPRWTVRFEARGTVYTKEVFAHSGTVLKNTLQYCPQHFKLGFVNVRKETVAVCEVCGRAYCGEHIGRCPVCGKWVCTDHAAICCSCGKTFCREHAGRTCPVCSLPLCSDCEVECPICSRIYGSDHTLVCDACGTAACPACVTTSGLLRKTTICSNCR
ncbi:hypothetical protein FGU65_02770 [Methanoculleus sp. FWC-SCC1]|uniref:Restriction endonuclease type IV Mrr domain-containing protein n=1 Tax=Methanoculleus frigidifontis TaxID=2584085 RepID=A0ABT8M7C1_9EURY|nr:restriction endonuclease [Methanoculleus sp. FWC-SCC1]MDN7023827.1 hypothetical protein [Methanoculleus sp. FWC-SCC1]